MPSDQSTKTRGDLPPSRECHIYVDLETLLATNTSDVHLGSLPALLEARELPMDGVDNDLQLAIGKMQPGTSQGSKGLQPKCDFSPTRPNHFLWTCWKAHHGKRWSSATTTQVQTPQQKLGHLSSHVSASSPSTGFRALNPEETLKH